MNVVPKGTTPSPIPAKCIPLDSTTIVALISLNLPPYHKQFKHFLIVLNSFYLERVELWIIEVTERENPNSCKYLHFRLSMIQSNSTKMLHNSHKTYTLGSNIYTEPKHVNCPAEMIPSLNIFSFSRPWKMETKSVDKRKSEINRTLNFLKRTVHLSSKMK